MKKNVEIIFVTLKAFNECLAYDFWLLGGW